MDRITFDATEFITVLAEMIEQTEWLQNGGACVANETRVADIVIRLLQSHIESGKIKCTKHEYVEGRANLILSYGEDSDRTITFAGSHFDVVPASLEQWDRNPFVLTVEGDKLYGRGTTDCLGHVALTTLILKALADNDVKLNYKFIVVFIADEEVGKDHDIGVLHLQKDGHLDEIKKGPVYWIDASDVVPVMACGTAMAWKLRVYGKKFHSGFPKKGINPIPIAMELTKCLSLKFNELCPKSDLDTEYNFNIHSNMKPTIWSMPEGSSANQFSDWVEVIGDVRMTPFYDPFKVKDEICQYMDSFDLSTLEKWHEGFDTSCETDGVVTEARAEFEWVFGPYCGIACDNKSTGYNLIKEATLKYHPTCEGCSDLGAVPLVYDMQKSGIDIQIIGYGNTDAYHANNEYCTLSGMEKGFNILLSLLQLAQ
jgi:acetylornithine deacetylase